MGAPRNLDLEALMSPEFQMPEGAGWFARSVSEGGPKYFFIYLLPPPPHFSFVVVLSLFFIPVSLKSSLR